MVSQLSGRGSEVRIHFLPGVVVVVFNVPSAECREPDANGRAGHVMCARLQVARSISRSIYRVSTSSCAHVQPEAEAEADVNARSGGPSVGVGVGVGVGELLGYSLVRSAST